MQKKIETKILESTPFHQACAEGDLQKCQELFADNLLSGDIIYPEYLSTGLNFAVQNNHAEVVSWLLENNASLYNKNTKNAGGQLVDMPFDEENKSCQTAFSFCSNTEINSLLCQSPGYFSLPQQIVIQCESIICQLDPALITITSVPPIIESIQSLITKTVTYTDASIIALNALAKSFFDLECYPQAQFCYESVKHLLDTKKYQPETQVRTAFNLKNAKKFLEYNSSVVQLKLNANSGEHTNNFEKIGDRFVKSNFSL